MAVANEHGEIYLDQHLTLASRLWLGTRRPESSAQATLSCQVRSRGLTYHTRPTRECEKRKAQRETEKGPQLTSSPCDSAATPPLTPLSHAGHGSPLVVAFRQARVARAHSGTSRRAEGGSGKGANCKHKPQHDSQSDSSAGNKMASGLVLPGPGGRPLRRPSCLLYLLILRVYGRHRAVWPCAATAFPFLVERIVVTVVRLGRVCAWGGRARETKDKKYKSNGKGRAQQTVHSTEQPMLRSRKEGPLPCESVKEDWRSWRERGGKRRSQWHKADDAPG